MNRFFKASDIRKVVGDDRRINRVLKRLVEDKVITRVSGKKYIVTPPKIVERADWVS